MVAPELAYLGKPVTMPPSEQVADWIYVRDAAEVSMRAYRVEDPAHRVLNMAGECRRSGELSEHLRALFPEAPLAVSNEPLVMNSLLDTGRLRETLDFTPRYSVAGVLPIGDEDPAGAIDDDRMRQVELVRPAPGFPPRRPSARLRR